MTNQNLEILRARVMAAEHQSDETRILLGDLLLAVEMQQETIEASQLPALQDLPLKALWVIQQFAYVARQVCYKPDNFPPIARTIAEGALKDYETMKNG